MANIALFVKDDTYRRKVLKYIDLEINKKISNKHNKVFFNDSNIVIDLKNFHKFKPDEVDSEDEYEDKYDDDFEIEQLHRYESNLVTILNYLLQHHQTISKNSKCNFTQINFKCNKYDFSSAVKNKYSEGWIYSVFILLLIDDKLLDYYYISQSVGDHYQNKQHILAYDNELLFKLSENEFDSMFSESENESKNESENESESENECEY